MNAGFITTGLQSGVRRRLIPLFAAALAAAGCKSRPAAEAVREPVTPPPVEMLKKPAIDLSRGAAGFPLETTAVPTSAEGMVDALRAGYALRLEAPDDIDIRVAEGGRTGRFKELSIDISGSKVRQDFVPKPQPKEATPVTSVQADVMRYTADPLNYQHFTAGMKLEAKNATLSVLPAGDGTFGLSLADCTTGHASLRLSMAGLRESLAKGVKLKSSLAFMVDNVDLDLASDNPRSLEADVVVHARLFLIPADFRITGRADVDGQFNVHFTKLNATGLDPTGRVVAGIIQGKLDKLNNKAAPLLKLPGDRIRLSGLAIDVGETLNVEADLVGLGGDPVGQ